MNEVDTCRKFVVPKLLAARRANQPHSSRPACVAQIIGKFGGAEQRRNAMNQLSTLLDGA
jgi:hypothetical protein